jgi:hypothetical protein
LVKVKISLEDSLNTYRGPAMPADVEQRIRQRIMNDLSLSPRGAQRLIGRFSLAQALLLAALLIAMAWTVQSSVLPTLRSLWERSHCAPTGRR